MRKIELLSPAGSIEKLKVSLRYGADAVYLGGKAFNLRAMSSNFANSDIVKAVDYAHAMGRKVYVTLNILAHDRDIKALPKFIKFLEASKVDAVIVADLGVLDLVREHSDLPIHISTQASSTNWRTVKMYQKLGAKRVVLAREMSINEIRRIKDQIPEMELEAFVHGAMCMTYSGRCNLSKYFTDRDSNRGVCTNSCRWKYSVVEEKRPGEYFPVYEDETGTYMYNSKDLCSIEFVDQLVEAGLTSLKIEGRMKSHYYCASATKTYRQALDSYLGGHYSYKEQWKKELEKISHRGYTSGFYHGGLDKNSEQTLGESFGTHRFAGFVTGQCSESDYLVDIKEKFDLNSELELLKPNSENQTLRIKEMKRFKNNEAIEIAQPNMKLRMSFDQKLEPLDIIAIRTSAE